VLPQDDVFAWTGNTRLSVSAANGLLANDPAGTVIAAADTTTAQGGTVAVNLASGAFVYEPPAGLQNAADTFTYTTSGATPTTVTIKLAERIWYVNNVSPAGGTGTLASPFNTLAAAEAASDENDTIFVFTGVLPAPTDAGQDLGITLKPGQKLRGQGLELRFNGVPLASARVNAPVISNAGLTVPGDLPVVQLATGNEVAGFTLQAAFNEGILATGGSGHDLHDNAITFDAASGREGIRLLNITGENLVTVNTITGSPRDGIKLANNENIAGDPVAATPIVAAVSISRNTITGSAQDGIAVRLDGAGTAVALNVLTNSISNSGGSEGIDIGSLGAAAVTAVVSRNTIAGSNQEAIDQSAAGTSGLGAFVANNNLSASGAGTDFSAAVGNAGAAFCLELLNNFNAAGNSSFLAANNGGVAGDFRFFEPPVGNPVANDTLISRVGPVTDIVEGACAVPLDGTALFVANCAKCHTGNGLGLTTVKQLIANDITNATVAAINLQFAVNGSMIMDFLPAGRLQLTQQEIAAIAAALAAVP
jgi:hypothetical protein